MSRRYNPDSIAEDWRLDAACAGSEPDIFFPNSQEEQKIIAAIACGSCAVKYECLEYALENREDDGVWGGATEEERRMILKIRRNQQEPA